MLLAFTRLDFVAAEVFLGLGVGCVLAGYWVVFSECQFALPFGGAVLGVDRGVVRAVTAQITDQTNQLSLRILLCHLFTRYVYLQS